MDSDHVINHRHISAQSHSRSYINEAKVDLPCVKLLPHGTRGQERVGNRILSFDKGLCLFSVRVFQPLIRISHSRTKMIVHNAVISTN